MKRIVLLTMILHLVVGAAALAGEKHGGLALSYAAPEGEFDKVADAGFGVSAIFDYPMAGIVNISGSLGWYRFSGVTMVEGTNVKAESRSVWEFTAGPQIDFGKLYIGLEGGYYTDLDEWGLVPNIGFRHNLIDLSLRYKATEDGKFFAGRVGVFF